VPVPAPCGDGDWGVFSAELSDCLSDLAVLLSFRPSLARHWPLMVVCRDSLGDKLGVLFAVLAACPDVGVWIGKVD
jgi:hypothetical protein